MSYRHHLSPHLYLFPNLSLLLYTWCFFLILRFTELYWLPLCFNSLPFKIFYHSSVFSCLLSVSISHGQCLSSTQNAKSIFGQRTFFLFELIENDLSCHYSSEDLVIWVLRRRHTVQGLPITPDVPAVHSWKEEQDTEGGRRRREMWEMEKKN